MIFLPFWEKAHMKNTKPQSPNANPHFNANKHRPENKDDMDSRSGEEQLDKGNSTTHNKREHKSEKKSTGDKKENS